MTSWHRTSMQSNASRNVLRDLQQQWIHQHHLLQRSPILWETQPTSSYQNSICQYFRVIIWNGLRSLICSKEQSSTSCLRGNQKLQYLKASVKGDAATLLAPIPVTDHNIDIAMITLINRYENKGSSFAHTCIQLFRIDQWQPIMPET